jgi:uncharacterized repeat protein (TIGR01451 family)
MKKIINLIILFGFLTSLAIIIILFPRASMASTGNPIFVGDNNNPEQIGPPWYNEEWHYRRPVSISNSGNFLPYYQVLIILDNTNFDFNLAKTDGSDIRVTDSSGKNPLLFWIESWDQQNQLAYLWVLVSSLTPEPYDASIYLYYNNPNAMPVSEYPSPFDFFDDNWCQFPGAGCQLNNGTPQLQSPFGDGISTSLIINPFSENLDNLFPANGYDNGYALGSNSWITLTEMLPSVASGILTLNNGVGIKTNNPFQYQAVGFRANYGLGTGREWAGFINGINGQRTVIGDLPSNVNNLYIINFHNDNNVPLPGGWHNGFHIYEIRWKTNQSMGDVDHGASTVSNLAQVPNIPLPLTLYNDNSGPNTTLLVDWVYVRQYRDPEPTFTVGEKQGLTNLRININDSPDPLRPGIKLTYQLTITNTSTINAPGVIVTDTLPANVQIGPVNASQGSCVSGSVILCNLGGIPAHSTASVTINVTPIFGGVITDTAIVSSKGYELDLNDNRREERTLVDSVPPVVEWGKPVKNGEIYYTLGGVILLEVSATDNDQVAWVDFEYYDGHSWITIGRAYAYPYQVPFNTKLLAPGTYPIIAYGVDRAGNKNDPFNPFNGIYVVKKSPQYLPLINK